MKWYLDVTNQQKKNKKSNIYKRITNIKNDDKNNTANLVIDSNGLPLSRKNKLK